MNASVAAGSAAFFVAASLFVLSVPAWGGETLGNEWANAGREGPRLARDEALLDISPFAALLQATQRYRLETSCETADFLTEVILEDEPREERALVSEFVIGIRSECTLFGLAEEQTRPVFESVKSAGELPERAFVFSLFVYDPNLEGSFAGYAEETVGLFVDLEDCRRVEQAARDLNLPTRRCAVWDEESLR